MKHRTHHIANPVDGKVLAACDNCNWRRWVDVAGREYWEAMAAIYAVRDAHEATHEVEAETS